MATTGKSYSSQLNQGLMLPTTNVWDVSQIYQIEDLNSDLRDLLVRLYQNINNIAIAVNLKDSGYYALEEFLTGKLLFPNQNPSTTSTGTPTYRQIFRMCINFGALPNNTTKQVPHYIDINSSYSIVSISGCATQRNPFKSIPIPYVNSFVAPSVADFVVCNIDDTYVNITTTSNTYINYELCYITIEYVKN